MVGIEEVKTVGIKKGDVSDIGRVKPVGVERTNAAGIGRASATSVKGVDVDGIEGINAIGVREASGCCWVSPEPGCSRGSDVV